MCACGGVRGCICKYIKCHVAYVISVHKLTKSAAKDLPSLSNCTKPQQDRVTEKKWPCKLCCCLPPKKTILDSKTVGSLTYISGSLMDTRDVLWT